MMLELQCEEGIGNEGKNNSRQQELHEQGKAMCRYTRCSGNRSKSGVVETKEFCEGCGQDLGELK